MDMYDFYLRDLLLSPLQPAKVDLASQIYKNFEKVFVFLNENKEKGYYQIPEL